jgi:hypothetical protein
MNNNRLVRNLLKITGFIGIVIFIYDKNILFLLAGSILLFLGLTNFGKECPLVLSVHHWYYRFKNRKSNSN